MRTTKYLGSFAALALVAGGANAQLGTPIPGGAYDLVPISIALAIPGGATANTGFLGIESTGEDAAGDRHWWVTTRGTGAAGGHWVADVKEDPITGGIIGVAAYAQGAASGGVWGYRDGANDGQFLYFGVEGGFIHEFDPVTGAPTGNMISVAAAGGLAGTARALAYRYSTDTFIAANFNSIVYEINRAGVVVDQTAAATGQAHYGFAVTTNWNPPTGGPAGSVGEMLWSYQQTGNTNVEYMLTGGPGLLAPTGISFPQIIPPFNTAGIAGGSCAYSDATSGKHEIANLVQGTPNDAMIRYEHSSDPRPPATLGTVGAAFCDPAGAPPYLRAINKAVKGRVFRLRVKSCVAGVGGAGILVLGVPGPFAPAFWAPAGNFIQCIPVVFLGVGLPAPPAEAALNFYIPIDPLLCGSTVCFQNFQLYAAAPPAGCTLPACGSAAVTATIGGAD